ASTLFTKPVRACMHDLGVSVWGHGLATGISGGGGCRLALRSMRESKQVHESKRFYWKCLVWRKLCKIQKARLVSPGWAFAPLSGERLAKRYRYRRLRRRVRSLGFFYESTHLISMLHVTI
ncbi:unnamed protein product, partial [Laminaria digitata]